MADLYKICSSMYRIKDQKDLIKECIENPENKSLGTDVLEQIESKCGALMPLETARACALELGLAVPESMIVYKSTKKKIAEPEVKPIVVALTPLEQCRQNCEIKSSYPSKDWDQCMDQCIPNISPKPEKVEERKKLSLWGKLAFKFGPDMRKRHALFNNAFKEWKADNPASPNDGIIDRGWQTGERIAITTGPGFTRWPWSKKGTLFKGTLLDLTFFREKTYDFAGEPGVRAGDNSKFTLLDAEWQFPFFDNNFIEFGTSFIKEDQLWWKNSNPHVVIPRNVHGGFNWPFQGTPVSISNKILDAMGMPNILSSYTMLGGRVDIAKVNLYPKQKGVEFCNQISDDCKDSEIGSRYFLYGTDPNAISGLANIPDDSDVNQLKVTAHLFGEQQWRRAAITYRGYVDHYPLWKKLEVGGFFSFNVNLGKALRLFVELEGRKLWSLKEDNNILLPDDAFELGATAGIGFHPLAFF